MRTLRVVLAAMLIVLMVSAITGPGAGAATRHRLYVGTITAISTNALTIHSKTHQAYYHFVIDNNTRFLHHGQAVPRTLFRAGSYVTVSYSGGPNNTLIAWHISLRK